MRFSSAQSLGAVLVGLFLNMEALAQASFEAYPVKPVTMILPFAAGGINDIEMRVFTDKLSDSMGGKPFLFDFRPGAGGTLGSAFVAKAAPDGYTLLAVSTFFTITPAFYKNLPFDTVRDFTPISLMSKRGSVLAVHPSQPAKNFAEYVAYVRANPGKLNFATTGSGATAHLSGAWLSEATKSKVTFIHYKGVSQLLPDFLSGQIHATFMSNATVMSHLKAGKLRAIAVSDTERNPLFPNLPTIAEQGVPEFEYSSWLGMAGPRGIPPAIVNKLSNEIAKVAKMPEIALKFSQEGSVSIGSSPEQFRQYYVRLIERWQTLVRDADIKLEE